MSPPDTDSTPSFPESRHVLEPGCARCPVLAECRERISWGTGALDAPIVVVGEAPGYGDPEADRWRGGNWTGMAYTSRHSGRRIRRLLDRLGYEAYFTNAVKCFPASEGSEATGTSNDPAPTNREPTAAERANCRRHLLAELETVHPDVVLATGKHATTTVLAAEGRGLEGFLESVLTPVRCDRLETTLVPILHPSYQDVWIGRLGYEPETYVEAIDETLAALCDPPRDR